MHASRGQKIFALSRNMAAPAPHPAASEPTDERATGVAATVAPLPVAPPQALPGQAGAKRKRVSFCATAHVKHFHGQPAVRHTQKKLRYELQKALKQGDAPLACSIVEKICNLSAKSADRLQ